MLQVFITALGRDERGDVLYELIEGECVWLFLNMHPTNHDQPSPYNAPKMFADSGVKTHGIQRRDECTRDVYVVQDMERVRRGCGS